MLIKNKLFISIFLTLLILVSSCGKFKPASTKDVPTNAMERARKNVSEGRGASIGNLLKRKGTNYEFSTSNPMWRASLEILDFLPLSVVDYSGGVIITDWYNDEANSKNSLKITLRFLSNEIMTNSLKIIVHERSCSAGINCSIKILNSDIQKELLTTIIKKAAVLELESKTK